MKNIHLTLIISLVFLISLSVVMAEVNSVTPSTNDINRDNGWAHVNVLNVGIGEITLQFIQPRAHSVCFEYKTDGDITQMVSESHQRNPDITDGQYNDVCLSNGVITKTFSAKEYIEIRMVSGYPEERFDWTLFEVFKLTKADRLRELGVKGKGIDTAPGLQKEIPNDNFAQANNKTL